MKILITGTPGVGKTTVSKVISQKFNLEHIELSKFIREKQIYEDYDPEYDTYNFDDRVVSKELEKCLENSSGIIIDTHSPECVTFIDFDLIFVMKLDNEELYKRLKARNYSPKKIRENINYEIFGVAEETVEDCFGQDFFMVGDLPDCISEKMMFEEINKHLLEELNGNQVPNSSTEESSNSTGESINNDCQKS